MTRPPLVLVPQHFGSLVFDRRTSRYTPFDAETTALLRRSVNTPAWALAWEEETTRPEAIAAFVEHFEREGFFRADGRLAGTILPATPPPDHLLGPLAVHLEVIAACNLACAHCFAGELPRKADLSLDEIDRLFGELASLGSYRVGLTGGEPLLRKDLFDVVDAATSHGLHPCLTTNGLLLDERVARGLGERDLVWVNVSLEGASAATNDAVRGAGTFDEVVRRLRAFGRHMRFTLAFTITRDNAHEVEACAALARELGAHTAVFRPLYPVGVARAHPELAPSYEQYADALDRLARLSLPRQGDGAGVALRAIDPFSPVARKDTQASTYAGPGCGAANLVASVSATGEVNPCSFLGAAFDAGNVRARPFAEIWRDSHVFRALRRDGACSSERGGFRGGCRARALAAHGSVDARDPWHDAWLAVEGGASADRQPLANLHVRAPRRLPLVGGGA